MKVLKEGVVSKLINLNCLRCESLLEISRKDLIKSPEYIDYEYIICPVCNNRIQVDSSKIKYLKSC